jgi:hypothetical protein
MPFEYLGVSAAHRHVCSMDVLSVSLSYCTHAFVSTLMFSLLQEKLEFAKERERLRAELARDKAERAAAYVLLTYALTVGCLSLGPVLRCTCMRGKA